MSEQLPLMPVPAQGRRQGRRGPVGDVPLAAERPVAKVLVETPLAHLDRPFEYTVPAELHDAARAGVRVRVRLAGRDHDGILLSREEEAEHAGRLAPLRSVVSPEPVLSPVLAAEIRQVADHYGGTAADVLRLALPPRHARAERSVPDIGPGAAPVPVPEVPGPWADYPAGPALLRRVAAGQAPAASWLALPCRPPDQDWPAAVAVAVRTARAAGRGSIVVVPDHRDVQRVLTRLGAELGEDDVVQLTADLGPEARYSAFLRVLRGHARVVVGTRSAAFAPVHDLGLLVCWDEADDLHQEPRAPYPHVREILRLRAAHERAALVLGGFTRSVVVQRWVEDRAVAPVAAAPAAVRAHAPTVTVAGEGWQEARDAAARTARIPSLAWQVLKDGLTRGPVLVQVPRQGYVVGLACQDCRTPVRCERCQGPVGAGAAGREPRCRWCGTGQGQDRPCSRCGSVRRRATGVGERRTAEELGRAFPGVLVRTSGGEHVLAEVGSEPTLVVATPGAEPTATGGYAAVALLDGWRLLERASLDAGVEALRRWCGAAALAAPGRTRVILCGVPPHGGLPAVEALIRWDPSRLAAQELAERTPLGLPPAQRQATVAGPRPAVLEVTQALGEVGHRLVGVSPSALRGDEAGGGEAYAPAVLATVREVEVAGEPSLANALHSVRAARSARKASEQVRMVLDGAD